VPLGSTPFSSSPGEARPDPRPSVSGSKRRPRSRRRTATTSGSR
jgi:hypothetical protein